MQKHRNHSETRMTIRPSTIGVMIVIGTTRMTTEAERVIITAMMTTEVLKVMIATTGVEKAFIITMTIEVPEVSIATTGVERAPIVTMTIKAPRTTEVSKVSIMTGVQRVFTITVKMITEVPKVSIGMAEVQKLCIITMITEVLKVSITMHFKATATTKLRLLLIQESAGLERYLHVQNALIFTQFIALLSITR